MFAHHHAPRATDQGANKGFRSSKLIAEQCIISSSLLRLPPEILLQILRNCDINNDAVAVAVSCKSWLQLAALSRLRVPSRQAHCAPWIQNQRKESKKSIISKGNNSPSCSCRRLEDVLRRFQPRDNTLRHPRSWNLCVDCACFRPVKKVYWSRKLAQMDTAGWSKHEYHIWQGSVTWFVAGIKVQCPTCRMSEFRLEMVSRPVG